MGLCGTLLGAFMMIVGWEHLGGSSRTRLESIEELPVRPTPAPQPRTGIGAPDPGDNP